MGRRRGRNPSSWRTKATIAHIAKLAIGNNNREEDGRKLRKEGDGTEGERSHLPPSPPSSQKERQRTRERERKRDRKKCSKGQKEMTEGRERERQEKREREREDDREK